MSSDPVVRAEIVVDLAAVRANVRALAAHTRTPLMVVVKADAYGHGLLPVARAAREAGAQWLGAAALEEALALREAGDTGRILTWLFVPGEERLTDDEKEALNRLPDAEKVKFLERLLAETEARKKASEEVDAAPVEDEEEE